MKAEVHDERLCELGEGAFWHPLRKELFWFDILNHQLLSRVDGKALAWQFDRPVSAAGWIDRDTLLIAGAGSLMRFDIVSGDRSEICPLEADKPQNRSNDGRADPWGGFWIGTMGRKAEFQAGSIWRFHQGEMRRLFSGITIPNAICFSPDAAFAYYADTREKRVWRVALAEDGWPAAEPEIFLDLVDENLEPDGAVTDIDGALWLAHWGAGRVDCYSPAGVRIRTVEVSASQPSCPVFGGDNLSTLFITSAREGLSARRLAEEPLAGAVFRLEAGQRGRAADRVLI